ncbi:MAG: ceramidase domain-containing protein [bacterium]
MRRIALRKIRKGFFFTLKRPGKWFVFELKRFFVPLAIFIGVIGLLIFVTTKDIPWRDWRLTTGFPERVFCEGIREGTVRQPLNSWSSLIFVAIGLWASRRAFLDKRQSPKLSAPVRRETTYGNLYGLALIIMGVGSWFFHASLTYVGHFVDVAGMYFLGGFLFTYGLSRKLQQSATAFLAVYAAVVLPLVLVQWFRPETSRYTFGLLILSALGIEVIFHKSLRNKLFIGALVSLALGFGIWVLDERKLLCWPNSCLQGHAMWHILTGLSTQFSYMYYRSEAPRINWKIRYRPWRYKSLAAWQR